MREVVICEPVRSPIGRYGGIFKSMNTADLAVTVLKGLLERGRNPRFAIDDVILGHQCSIKTVGRGSNSIANRGIGTVRLSAITGIDVPTLENHVDIAGSIVDFPGATGLAEKDELLFLTVDLLFPAAVEGVISAATASRVQAKFIVEAANVRPLQKPTPCWPNRVVRRFATPSRTRAVSWSPTSNACRPTKPPGGAQKK